MRRIAWGLVCALGLGVGVLMFARESSVVTTPVAPHATEQIELGPDGRRIAPPVPAPGSRDSLIALASAPAELLARYETREMEYEQPALAVYGQGAEHYLVATTDSTRAWVHQADAGAYYPIEQIIVNRLNWLTPSWDLHVRDEPSSASPRQATSVAPGTREVPANVLEHRLGSDGAWLRVEVLGTSPCEGGTPKVIATGWIPLWGSDAKPTAWFYSRGC